MFFDVFSKLINIRLPEEIVTTREIERLLKEFDVFLGALCQRPPLDGRGTADQSRKKSTSSSVPCVSARH